MGDLHETVNEQNMGVHHCQIHTSSLEAWIHYCTRYLEFKSRTVTAVIIVS